jgi:DNA-binding NtrC family response regulator
MEIGDTMKIAIVDDDPDVRTSYSMMLERLGIPSPEIFNDGTSLVNAIIQANSSFSIIFMDYQMPQMNGIETAKIVSRFCKHTRIIMISGYEEARGEASKLGIEFLPKPVSLLVFRKLLEKPLEI